MSDELRLDWIVFKEMLKEADVSSEQTKTGSAVDPRFDDLHVGFYTGVKHARDRAKATIATLTAERDALREREAMLMTDSLLKADEIKRLKAELHLAETALAQLKEQPND